MMDESTEKPTPKKRGRGRPPILEAIACAAAIVQLRGNIAAVARRFKVARSSVVQFVEKDDGLKKVLVDTREEMLDGAENALYRAVLKGESWAVCFFLKTQGRGRGYIERVDAGKVGEKEESPLVVGGEAKPDNL